MATTFNKTPNTQVWSTRIARQVIKMQHSKPNALKTLSRFKYTWILAVMTLEDVITLKLLLLFNQDETK